MNSALKWKLVAGLLLVFVAGGLTGAFVAAATTRHYLSAAGHHRINAERMRERLKSELNLTPEQMAKISPVVNKTAAQLEAIRRDTATRVRDVFADAHGKIAVDLTPEQRAKLESLRRRHHRMLRRFHHQGGERSHPAPAATVTATPVPGIDGQSSTVNPAGTPSD